MLCECDMMASPEPVSEKMKKVTKKTFLTMQIESV